MPLPGTANSRWNLLLTTKHNVGSTVTRHDYDVACAAHQLVAMHNVDIWSAPTNFHEDWHSGRAGEETSLISPEVIVGKLPTTNQFEGHIGLVRLCILTGLD
jgi:hypothetical protein